MSRAGRAGEPRRAGPGSRSRHNRSLLTNAGSMVGHHAGHLAPRRRLLAGRDARVQPGLRSASPAPPSSAMTLLGFMATLGLGTLLMGELPRRESGHRSAAQRGAADQPASLGAGLGLAFALIAPLVSSNFDPLQRDLAGGAGLRGRRRPHRAGLRPRPGADRAAARRPPAEPQHRLHASSSSLALVPVAALVDRRRRRLDLRAPGPPGIAVSLVVLSASTAPRAATRCGPNFGLLSEMRGSRGHPPRRQPRARARRTWRCRSSWSRSSRPRANASFYIAWMIASFLFMVPALAQHGALRGRLGRIGAARRVASGSPSDVSLGLRRRRPTSCCWCPARRCSKSSARATRAKPRHAPHPRPRHLPLDDQDALRRAPPGRAAACARRCR